MRITSRRKATITFLVLGVGLAGVAVAVGFGWIILNWREGIKVFLGVIFFGAITTGLVLNTIFLLREIRRNEQHDSFINAVTHDSRPQSLPSAFTCKLCNIVTWTKPSGASFTVACWTTPIACWARSSRF